MMAAEFKWGSKSVLALKNVHPKLREVADEALRISKVDFRITEGHRGKDLQDLYFIQKKSKLRFPKGRHNMTTDPAFVGNRLAVSDALDFWPLVPGHEKAPLKDHWKAVADAFFEAGLRLGVRLRWGGDFRMDGDKTLDDSWDSPHIELLWKK